MDTATQAVLCRYHYDPLDRLAAHELENQAEALCFYQNSRLATEIQGAAKRTVFQYDEHLLAQQEGLSPEAETTLLASDQQRSILNTLDSAGTYSARYSVYGHQQADSGLTQLFGFNGERRDPLTGHYLLGNGYRAFNPVLMRFNSPDSKSPFGAGGLNTYAFCQGDPVNYSDSTGHVPFKVLLELGRSKHSLKFILGRGVVRNNPILDALLDVPIATGSRRAASSTDAPISKSVVGSQRPQSSNMASSSGSEARSAVDELTTVPRMLTPEVLKRNRSALNHGVDTFVAETPYKSELRMKSHDVLVSRGSDNVAHYVASLERQPKNKKLLNQLKLSQELLQKAKDRRGIYKGDYQRVYGIRKST